MEEVIVGVVGVLQFDVLEYRLQSEYSTAVRRRARSGDDILFVFLTGVAQMAMHVDEARRDDLARRVVDLCLRVGQVLADRRDFAIRNQNIRHLVHTVGRVNHAAAANQQLFHQTFSLLVSI